MGASSSLLRTDCKKFFDACKNGQEEAVLKKLSKHPHLLSRRTLRKGNYAWHLAAEAGQVQALKALQTEGLRALGLSLVDEHNITLEQKVMLRTLHFDDTNHKGQTPLMRAAAKGHTDCVALLLRMGANIKAIDRCGSRTALHYAALNSDPAASLCLLQHEEELLLASGRTNSNRERLIDVQTVSGFTALHFAVANCRVATVKALLSYNPKLHARTWFYGLEWIVCAVGSTALHIAAHKGDLETTLLLLEAQYRSHFWGDLRCVRDKNGRQPHAIASLYGYDTLAQVLSPNVPLSLVVGESQFLGVPKLSQLAEAAYMAQLRNQLATAAIDSVKLTPDTAGKFEEPSCSNNLCLSHPGTLGATHRGPFSGDSASCSQPVSSLTLQGPTSCATACTSDYEDVEDDMCCGVCQDVVDYMVQMGCRHRLCGTCASSLLNLRAAVPPPCPFCRKPITRFTRFIAPTPAIKEPMPMSTSTDLVIDLVPR